MLPNTFIYYFRRLNCRLVVLNAASFIKLRILLSAVLFLTSYRQFLSFSPLLTGLSFTLIKKASRLFTVSFVGIRFFSCRVVFCFNYENSQNAFVPILYIKLSLLVSIFPYLASSQPTTREKLYLHF